MGYFDIHLTIYFKVVRLVYPCRMALLTTDDILYQDDYLVAIAKPHGLLVHRSTIAADATEFALQETRNLIGATINPVHRIDRKTYGVLLFALHPEAVRSLQDQWQAGTVHKQYEAICRGWLSGSDRVEHIVRNYRGHEQNATSTYQALAHYEIDLPHLGHKTSRYSRVGLSPITGRTHQLRQLMNHLRHPILGDRPHGCNKQNRLWLQHYQLTTMMLWAKVLQITHPVTKQPITISCEPSPEWRRVMSILGPPTKEISI